MAAMYAVYHGPEGIKTIAQRVHGLAGTFALGLKKLGTVEVQELPFFDTVKIKCADSQKIADAAYKNEMNLRILDKNTVSGFLNYFITSLFWFVIHYIVLYIYLIYDNKNHIMLVFRSLFLSMKPRPLKM